MPVSTKPTPTPHPGSEPRANPPARWIAVVFGLALLALAGVAARDLWFRWDMHDPANSWVSQALAWVGNYTADVLGVACGIVIALVGLWIFVHAFTPRVRTHVRATSESSVWIRPVDIARRATFIGRREAGGAHANSQATRKKLGVTVEDSGSIENLPKRVTDALEQEFSVLEVTPRIKVTAQAQQTVPDTEVAQ